MLGRKYFPSKEDQEAEDEAMNRYFQAAGMLDSNGQLNYTNAIPELVAKIKEYEEKNKDKIEKTLKTFKHTFYSYGIIGIVIGGLVLKQKFKGDRMITIRQATFETNSSSVHSLNFTDAETFKKWKNGEYVWDNISYELIPASKVPKPEPKPTQCSKCNAAFLSEDQVYCGTCGEKIDWKKPDNEDDDNLYQTYKKFGGYYECFDKEYTTKSGDKVVAFGYFGEEN
jgi:hypothetical protein